MENTIVKINPTDNVGIVCNAFGLQKGAIIQNDIILLQDIPMGHKVALEDIQVGKPIIRYGQIIGYANVDIQKAEWINENKLSLPQAPDLENIPYTVPEEVKLEPLTGYTFEGYRNPDGSVGTKNMLGITISVQCVAGITNYITNKIKQELLPKYTNVDDVVAFNHSYGCGIAINAPAAIIPIRTIKNIAQNPNFGGEVMVIGLGCEKLRPETLLPNLELGMQNSEYKSGSQPTPNSLFCSLSSRRSIYRF